MLAEYITALTIDFTEVTIYDFPGEEYAFRRRKRFSVFVSWNTSFHGRKRPAEKSFSVVVQQQTEGLLEKSNVNSTLSRLRKESCTWPKFLNFLYPGFLNFLGPGL